MEAQPQIAVPTPNLRGMADLLLLVTDGARQWPIVPTQLAAVAVPNLGVCVRNESVHAKVHNVEFWQGLQGLVMDGATFTRQYGAGASGGGRGSGEGEKAQ